MRSIARLVFRAAVVVALLGWGLWVVAPREPVDIAARFDSSRLPEDVTTYFLDRESVFDDIAPGVEKRIVWATEAGARAPYSLVYVHGFSATSEEVRPVPDDVARALAANLIYVRRAGHGRGGDALATATVADWAFDLDEALAVAERIGERTIVVSTSTGATLVAAALGEGREDKIDAVAMISPNFRIGDPKSAVLTFPFARYWVPPLFGKERSFEPMNEGHARYWTTR